MAVKVYGELTPASTLGILGDAKTIIDRKHGGKMQEDINTDVVDRISDKDFVVDSGKGLGRILLKKNKSLASQVTNANTVYIIQDDLQIGGGSAKLNPADSMTIGSTSYFYTEVTVGAGETITVESPLIIAVQNSGYQWVSEGTSYTAQSGTVVRVCALPYTTETKVDYTFTGQSTLTIPANCTLKFDGGSISGGTIVFNNTKLENPKFVNCDYSGNIQVAAIDDRCFTSLNDTSCLKWLLEQCLLLGIKLDVYRDYTFVMPSTSLAIIPQGVTVSNAVIDFHNHTITDTWAAERNGDIRGLILISGTVNGLTICNLNLIDQNNNTHLLAKSAGMCGLITKGECSGITLENIYQKYGDSIYRHGGYTVEQNLVINGVVNSKFCKLRVEDCGYSIAIYRGCNLDIDVEAIHPHRGLYLGAVDNSRVMYRGYYPEETHCHVLCQESVYYKDNTFTEWDMRGCSNLDINAEVMGVYSEQFYETILSFGTYGTGDDQEFVDRQSPTVHSNIKLTATVNGSNRVNSFIASSTSGNDSVVYLNNIELNGVDLSKSVNGIGFNLPAGFVDVKLKDCINGSSIPIAVHGDASAFSARITSERTDLGTITAKVPLEMIMINCISGGEGSSSTAGMLKTYSYPIRIKNGGRYGGNQFVGTTENRPSPDREIVGSMYFDDTIKKPLWYIDYWKDGTHPGAWIESDRSRAGVSRVGTFADRPVSTASDTSGIPNIQPGFRYLCTDGYGEIIFKEKSSGTDIWLEADGARAGVQRTGTTAQRPAGNYIYVGFKYFDTDLGKTIYASAIASSSPYTVTWVDADGNKADSRKLGLVAQRPSLSDIVTGFAYIVTQDFTATIEDPISGEQGETVSCKAGVYTYILPTQSWATPMGSIIADSDFPSRT